MFVWIIKSNFFMFECLFSILHWIYAVINNYKYIGARNTQYWFPWSINLRISRFSSQVVSWVMRHVWTVRDTVPGRCCSRAGNVPSPGAIMVSPHDSQNASLAAHRVTAVMSVKITMTTSARLKGKNESVYLFVNNFSKVSFTHILKILNICRVY